MCKMRYVLVFLCFTALFVVTGVINQAFAYNSLKSDFSGWWYDRSAPGTGVSLEFDDENHWLLAWYVFDQNGLPVWYTASGEITDSTHFSGRLFRWTGWPWGQPYTPPYAEEAGAIQGVLSNGQDKKIELTWTLNNAGSGVMNLVNFMQNISPDQPDSGGFTGWWFVPPFNGMGLFVEARGGTMFMAWYNYRDDGSPRWLTSSGDFPEGSLVYQGTLSLWKGGQYPGGPYRQPEEFKDQGDIKLTFIDSSKGLLEIGETTFELEKFFLRTDSGCFCIPYKTITIDGNFDDWQGLPVLANDMIGDTADAVYDVRRVYLARDNQFLYFRIDLREDLGDFHAFTGYSKFESYDPTSRIYRIFSVATDQKHFGEVSIQNFNGGSYEITKYYPRGFSAITRNKMEFKVRLSNTSDFDLGRKYIRAVVHNADLDLDDSTFNVLIEE